MYHRIFGLAAVVALGGCSPMFPSGPASRPGLGTAWGETRSSRVRLIDFERDDPFQPVAVATLYYDDAEGIAAMTAGASARGVVDEAAELAGGALRVRVLDAWGGALPILNRGGRWHVEGRDGERYAIEIANRSGTRVEAVATVDGLDAMTGRRGSFDNRGYVLGPSSSFRIDGFRQNLDQVAAFRFGSVAESYAAQKGDDGNVGVIGVAFFGERGARHDWFDREAARRRGADPFPGSFAQPP